jgi:hypothetical protein
MRKYSIVSRQDLEAIFPRSETGSRVNPAWTDAKNLSKHYRTKVIESGDQLEVETYPIWKTSMTRLFRELKPTRAAQAALNVKNTRKRMIRLTNANFGAADIYLTLTYAPKRFPATVEAADKEIANYMRRVKHYAKRHGQPELKYIYVTDFGADPKSKKRVHHHIIMNFANRDIAEKLWNGGGITDSSRLQPDEEYGLTGLAQYISNVTNGRKRFVTSKNLKQPEIMINDGIFGKRLIKRVFYNRADAAAEYEKRFPGYKFTGIKKYVSDWVSGVYMYVQMRRKR